MWLIVAVASFIVIGTAYVEVQQTYRNAANDPQIQIVEDIAGALGEGVPPENIIPPNPNDMTKSLSPFVIVYDASGKAIASTAQLNGEIPVPSSGVFDYIKAHGEDRITWQPQPGLRIAAVIQSYSGTSSGFVLAGRSLREVEKRELNALYLALIGWAAVLIVSWFAVWVLL